MCVEVGIMLSMPFNYKFNPVKKQQKVFKMELKENKMLDPASFSSILIIYPPLAYRST
jgi:hypothetical protein